MTDTRLPHDHLAGRYRLEGELGRGGMATVYLAQDLKLHRTVAIKVLRPELAASLGNQRFLREIEIAARLSHPHILPLLDSGDAGGHLYYVMPYVEGESLRQKLDREGQFPVAEVIAIVKAVASALTHAHQQGIVHRDIKPENILLAKNAEGTLHPLVADFGIARALDVAGGERLTETGLALGTPAYMSPEQAAGGRLDERSDIYSLGCVAYEMLAGSPPFTASTAQAILARHAVDPVPPLHTVRATIPPAVEYAVERALAKVPADRFSTPMEFAEAMVAEAPPAPRARRSARPSARKLVLGLVAGVVVLGMSIFVARHSAQPAVLASASRIAVLPFLSPGADTSLTRLGKDLATTISASLDGVGGIETADRLSIATSVLGKPELSPAEGAALARRLGASSVVRGTLVPGGDRVRLDLGIYETESLVPLAHGITVTAHRDSIATLTDSATWGLLRQVWQRGEPPTPSLASVTTRSLPALRAFLEGERELAVNHWEQAVLAFQSAVASDPTFWLAHFRYALTKWWSHQPVEEEVLKGLHNHRHLLSEQERLLLDGFLTSSWTLRLRIKRYEAAAQRFPNYWPAWLLYADALYHDGPVFGYDWTDGLKAFQRVLALNPKLVPAWEHVFYLALGRDHAVNADARARLAELGWPPPDAAVERLFLQHDAGIFAAGGVPPPHLHAVADSVAMLTVTSESEAMAMIFGPLRSLHLGFPATQIDLNRRALRRSKIPHEVTIARKASDAWSWIARGQWDRGLAIMGQLATPDPVMLKVTVLAIENYAMAVLGAYLGAVEPALADERRDLALRVIPRLADQRADPDGHTASPTRQHATARVAWLDGLLAYSRRDPHGIAAARKAAAASGWSQADLVDRMLATFEWALTGEVNRAGRELAELDRYCIDQEGCTSATPDISVRRFAAAQWLRQTGNLDEAASLLRWQEAATFIAWRWALGFALDAPTYLARARIEESRGQDSLAQEYYRQFLRRYDQPMPSQAHLVEEAKTALARLGRR